MGIESYQFPSDLGNYKNRTITFKAYESVDRDLGGLTSNFLNGADNLKNLVVAISLPCPINLADVTKHTWEQNKTFDTLENILSTGAREGLALASALASKAGMAVSGAGNLGANLVSALNAGASNPVFGLINLYAGHRKTLLNPGFWQNYKSSDPRTFSFEYTFQPRNEKEAIQCLNILRCFKRFSLPESINYNGGAPENITSNTESYTMQNYNTKNNSDTSSDTSDTSSDTTGIDFSSLDSVFKSLGKNGENIVNDKGLKIVDNTFSYFGAIKQPCVWGIEFDNNYITKLLQMDNFVCSSIDIKYGSSDKLELFEDGIPKIFSLSLDFAEIKLKYSENFNTPFYTKDVETLIETTNNAINVLKYSSTKDTSENLKKGIRAKTLVSD